MPSTLPTIALPPPLGGKANRESTIIPPTMLVDCENFYSRDQTVRLRDGLSLLGQSLAQRITGLVQYFHNDGVLRMVLGTTTGWWRYDIATAQWVDITGIPALTAGDVNLQVFRVFQKAGTTTLLGVNGKDSPKKWNGIAATYSTLGGTPPDAKTMMTLANRVMLGFLTSGSTQSPTAIDVSALNDFDSGWGSVLVALLADTPGDIVAMQEMTAVTGAIWKSDALYLAIAQGATSPFRFELRLAGIAGPVSAHAVVPLQDGSQLYLANDFSVKVFDGASVRHVGGENGYDLQRHIAATANSLQFGKAFGYLDKHRNMAWFYYPGIGQTACGHAVALDMSSGAFWPMRWTTQLFSGGLQAEVGSGLTIGELIGTIGGFDPGLTLGDFASSVPRVLTCAIGGKTYIDIGVTDEGTAIPFFLETGLTRSTPQVVTISAVEHLFRQASTTQAVLAMIGVSQAGETPVFDAGTSLDISGSGPHLSQHRATGKLFSLRLEGTATARVEWRGADAAYASRGRR